MEIKQERIKQIRERMSKVLEYDPGQAGPEGIMLMALAVLMELPDSPDPAGTPTDPFGDVCAFQQKMGFDYSGPPRETPIAMMESRYKHKSEELKEFRLALNENNQEKMLDALIDGIYVDLGTIRQMGWDFREAWRRVHEKNMQKMPGDIRRPKQGVWKPEGWTPPDHSDLVYKEPKA